MDGNRLTWCDIAAKIEARINAATTSSDLQREADRARADIDQLKAEAPDLVEPLRTAYRQRLGEIAASLSNVRDLPLVRAILAHFPDATIDAIRPIPRHRPADLANAIRDAAK